jgi:hypothetical protein
MCPTQFVENENVGSITRQPTEIYDGVEMCSHNCFEPEQLQESFCHISPINIALLSVSLGGIAT